VLGGEDESRSHRQRQDRLDANNYYPNRDGHVPELDRDETTSTELLARHLPDARVVKAFNTMNYAILAKGRRPSEARR
jgi:predicted dinucleotide-binding enzyme